MSSPQPGPRQTSAPALRESPRVAKVDRLGGYPSKGMTSRKGLRRVVLPPLARSQTL